ncbi:MAG: hypothetical protein M3495_00475, partial [Pseudomonadota bacterium]|nr:hypothetical protein [Pseudomonadota bacterium]
AGRARRADGLAVPRFVYAPGVGDAPGFALPCGVRADQRVWRCSSSFASAGKPACADRPGISGTRAARLYRRAVPPRGGTRRRGGRTWADRNTTRKPMLLFRLSG